MMDIERLSQNRSTLGAQAKKKKSSGKSGVEKKHNIGFANIFDTTVEEESLISDLNLPVLKGDETLESLLDDIHESGEALKRDPVFGPLNKYKQSIRCFFRYVLNHAMEVGESTGTRNPRTMQQKKYVVVRIIDAKLENLAAHILRNQTDQLNILHRIDEIRGLLIDLAG